ncbi:MAG: acetate--CoA ligase family protein [Actinobacteria bacterium]|nr:acetate--CoA ligase family protein [Actinomycetota bacterium]
MRAREALSCAMDKGVTLLPEDEGKSLMAEYGISVPHGRRVSNLAEAERAAVEIGYPLVLKALVPGLAHKSESRAVLLNIADLRGLRSAIADMSRRFPEVPFLVEEMATEGAELIAGLVDDPQLGPCLMIGTGGIFTEVFEDAVFLLLPATRADIVAALPRLRGYRLLSGFRGSPPVDKKRLVDALEGLAKFGVDAAGYYDAVDINPLRAAADTTVALDVKVHMKQVVTARPEGRDLNSHDFAGFFEPRSVAIVGASNTPGKPGNTVIKNLIANGYQGEIYPVNPKGGEILGYTVYRSSAELPEGVDLAVIIVPAKDSPESLRDVASRGIKHVVLSAGGFAETSDTGATIQQELLDILAQNYMRALGPNTSGNISTPSRFTSSFFPLGELRRGNVGYIAQTGNFATFTMKYILTGEYFGVSRVVGLGNKIDVDESQALAYLGADPETHAIVMYVESIKYPRKFLEVARTVTREKPVVMLKGGATAAGKQAASAHTAALAAEDRIIDGLLRQAGITRLENYSDLVLAGKVLSMCPLPDGNRVGFLAPSGAMLVALSDLCTRLGLTLPSLMEETRERIQAITPSFIRIRKPVDIWAAALSCGVKPAYADGLDALLKDPNLDAVIAIFMLTREMGMPDSFSFVSELAQQHKDKPVLISFTGDKECMDECRSALEPLGIPTFMQIEEPFRALSILHRCAQVKKRPQ